MELEPREILACPTGCPSRAMKVISIPKDRLMLFCCQRCRVIQVQGSDGVAQFTARELHELGRMRLTFRMGERKA